MKDGYRFAFVPVIAGFSFVGASASQACSPTELAAITPTGASAGASEFGYSVGVDAGRVIVGMDRDASNGSTSGSAYIFENQGAGWMQTQRLVPADNTVSDQVGFSCGISGDYAIVGAVNRRDTMGVSVGGAYIYRFDGAQWVEDATLVAPDGNLDSHLGWSTAISGDVAIAGAPDHAHGSPVVHTGAAYVYRRFGSVWALEQELLAFDGVSSDKYGYSVAASGDVVIVGAYADDDAGPSSGAAYVYRYTGSSWAFEQKLVAPDAVGILFFGLSVALDGDHAIIGARGDNTNGSMAGAAYAFKFDGNQWNFQTKLLASDGVGGDFFGHSVAVSGNTAVVGAYVDVTPGVHNGSAYVYTSDGSQWTQQAKLTAASTNSREFGYSVGVSGNTAIIGARDGFAQGSAHVFDLACEAPCPADTNHDGMLTPADFTAWIAAFNAQAPECDQNGDSLCTPADFTAWIANYNAGC